MIVLCNIKLDTCNTLYNCGESTHMYQNEIKWRCIDTLQSIFKRKWKM